MKELISAKDASAANEQRLGAELSTVCPLSSTLFCLLSHFVTCIMYNFVLPIYRNIKVDILNCSECFKHLEFIELFNAG
jgi:hypothetical protein